MSGFGSVIDKHERRFVFEDAHLAVLEKRLIIGKTLPARCQHSVTFLELSHENATFLLHVKPEVILTAC